MKIEHFELIIAALAVALLFITWSLLRTFLSSRAHRTNTQRAGWRRLTWQRLRLNHARPHAGVARLRQLRPISEHDNGVFAGGGDGYASLTCQIEARLEIAFEQFSRGRISIHTYRSLAEIEADLIAERIAEAHNYWPGHLHPQADEAELDPDLADALTLVQWCLDWADDMMLKLGVDTGPANHPAAQAHHLQTA